MIIGSKFLYYKSVSSTNSLASELLSRERLPEGAVIYTDYQTAGKGQPGKRWESENGKNLLISIILYPSNLKPGQQFLLTVTFSLGICDFLDRHFSGSKIKWPNDIYVKNDKIAGILIENSILEDSVESSIAGIGLNINQENFPSEIPNAVSLKMLTGIFYDTGNCIKDLSENLDRRYKQLLYGDREELHNEYIRRLFRFDEFHWYHGETGKFEGKITDVSSSGLLKIIMKNGQTLDFQFREIDFIL